MRRAAVCDRPVQQLDVPANFRVQACRRIPRTSVRARPLKHLEVPALRRPRARALFPWAAVLTQPLQHLELPVSVTKQTRFRGFRGLA